MATLDRVRAQPADPASPLSEALDRVGDRWTLLIVETLLDGPRRFGDLIDAIPGLAPNILTRRLRDLERATLIVTRPYSSRPPRFVYELSDGGRELAGALRLLADWGARQSDAAEPLRHSVCGTALEARWHCPVCDVTLEDSEPDETRII
jgi:DNA-binding HxlR family transcriptional regulator